MIDEEEEGEGGEWISEGEVEGEEGQLVIKEEVTDEGEGE